MKEWRKPEFAKLCIHETKGTSFLKTLSGQPNFDKNNNGNINDDFEEDDYDFDDDDMTTSCVCWPSCPKGGHHGGGDD